MLRLRKLTVYLTQDRVAGRMVELDGLFTIFLIKQWSADPPCLYWRLVLCSAINCEASLFCFTATLLSW